jgi:hypothetical protein
MKRFLVLILLLSFFIMDIAYSQDQGVLIISETVSTNETLPEKCETNLGEPCLNNDECKGCYGFETFCLRCPIDTQVSIQIDPDPYYVGLTNGTANFVTKVADKGYCAYRGVGTRSCVGNWDGDEYLIIPTYETTDYSIYLELTKEVLDKWKSLILRNISEKYLRDHINVSVIETQVDNNLLGAGIQYTFKYDWVETENTDREIIYIKELSNGDWVWLSDEEITRRFDEFRQFLHNMVFSDDSIGAMKATEYEINSIISREEAVSKLKQCHKDIELERTIIGSKNNLIQLIASGKVNLNTERCEINHENTYTVVSAIVDLITGEFTCTSHESTCVVYAAEKGVIVGGTSNTIIYIVVALVILITFILLKRRKRTEN